MIISYFCSKIIVNLMKKTLVSALVMAAFGLGASAQISLVSPVPQRISVPAALIAPVCPPDGASYNLFDIPAEWTVVAPKTLPDFVLKALTDAKPAQVQKGAFTITLGTAKDATVKKVKKLIPAQAEGYYLDVAREGITIAGRDARGLYYGIQTLLQIMSEGRLEVCNVTDWPDVAFRGSIEGFYGRPWSHEHRLRQLDFYGQNKMNVYIYGPKDDPYHRKNWREAYPADEAAKIQELNERAKLRGVNFYWAIHPGLDIQWNDEDRQNLVNKLEKMYDLGIRSFAVFFDDIWGEGAKGENQAALLNYVDDVFVKKHGDVAPLLLCPTEYNRAWSRDDSPYLAALGDGLHKGIEVMWTGNSVVHCINKEGQQWINDRIKRKAYIWWNFPVNDFVRDHMLLGPTYGNDLDIADMMSGFVSNPMQYAESSKVALYSIADYTWNMKAYDWASSWEKAIKNLLPSEASALRTFAIYNEDLGPNGHGFRRDEGREIAKICELAAQGDAHAINELNAHSALLQAAANRLLASDENPWLIDELRPWLVQANALADYAQTVCAMKSAFDYNWDERRFLNLYQTAKAIRKQMFQNENDPAQLHDYQTGTKLGTLRYLPALNKLFALEVERYNVKYGTTLDTTADYCPFAIDATVPQLALLPFKIYGSEVSINPSNEVIKWPADSYFTVNAEQPITLQGMDFNFGTPGIASKFRLEVQQPDGQWREVSLLHYKEQDPVIHTGNELGGMQARAFRITNVSGEEVQCYFRHFKFNKR